MRQRQMSKWKGLSFALMASALLALGSPAPQARGADGKHGAAGKTVTMEEYISFRCSHCNEFRAAVKPLLAKYKKRLHFVSIPIPQPGTSDAVIRLFYIAEKAGLGENMKDIIFDAQFQNGVDVFDPAVAGYLAQTSGLGQAYHKDIAAPWVNQRLQADGHKISAAQVEATPTVFVNGQKIVPEGTMAQFIQALDARIAQGLQ